MVSDLLIQNCTATHHPGDAAWPTSSPLCIPRVQKTQRRCICNFWNNSALEVTQNILPHSCWSQGFFQAQGDPSVLFLDGMSWYIAYFNLQGTLGSLKPLWSFLRFPEDWPKSLNESWLRLLLILGSLQRVTQGFMGLAIAHLGLTGRLGFLTGVCSASLWGFGQSLPLSHRRGACPQRQCCPSSKPGEQGKKLPPILPCSLGILFGLDGRSSSLTPVLLQ